MLTHNETPRAPSKSIFLLLYAFHRHERLCEIILQANVAACISCVVKVVRVYLNCDFFLRKIRSKEKNIKTGKKDFN